MNYAKAADTLSSKGRYGDTTMVHMNPMEVSIMDRMTPGGLSVNPDTGKPEAFAFLLPLLASAIGPGIMSSLGLSGLGAILGTGALTGLTNYAVTGDAEGSLLSGALGGLGAGLAGGLGQGAKAGADAAKLAATTATTAAPTAATSALQIGAPVASNVANAANAAKLAATAAKAAPAVGLGGLATSANPMLSTIGKGVNYVVSKPLTMGLPLALSAASADAAMNPPKGTQLPGKTDKYTGDYERERLPYDRQRNMYQGDISRYGQDTGGEFNYFTPNDPRTPNVLGQSGLGNYVPRYADGGRHVQGPGTGRSDSINAVLSNGEYVIPADAVAAMGEGSNDAGANRLDKMVAQIRAMQPKGAPPRRPAMA